MGKCMTEFVDALFATGDLPMEQFIELLKFRNIETMEYLFLRAREVRKRAQKKGVRIMGRIPVSSFCKYNCKLCGLMRDNQFAKRYRLDVDQILQGVELYYQEGIREILLESGDDAFWDGKHMAEVIMAIRKKHRGLTITLALGEKKENVYRQWKSVGADGYILGHGSANELHYKKIFPANMSSLLRKQCLWQLKEIGYQVGGAILVGMPYQVIENLVEDLLFVRSFEANMVQVNAFMPAPHTPFEKERPGNGEMANYIVGITRLLLPSATIMVDASLDCVLKNGRSKALDAGADVLIVDLPEANLMDAYTPYERRCGRLALPLEQVGSFVDEANRRK